MKKAKKRRILEKGIELFGSTGYLKTTVEDITNSLNISKGSFYTYFDSKQSLLLGILNYLFEEHCIMLDKISKDTKDKDVKDTLKLYLKSSLKKSMTSNNEKALIQQLIINDFFQIGKTKVEEIKDKFDTTELEFMRKNIFSKLGKNRRDLNENLVMHYVTSVVQSLTIMRLKEKEAGFMKQNKEEVIDTLTSLILYGIQKEEL